MIKAVIFDCFGVLYPDTLAIIGRPYLKTDDPRREDLRYLRKQTDLGQLSRDEFWDGAAKLFGISRRELNQQLERLRGADWDLLNFIHDLKPKYKTAILSNVGRGFIERIFEGKPSTDYFDVLALSFESGELKPAPGPYLQTASKLALPPADCLMVDDSPANCQGAEAVGMQSLLYKDFDQFRADFKRFES